MGRLVRFGGIISAAFLLASAGALSAQDTNDPGTGGQQNRQWGKSVSSLAQRETPEGTHGGGMGQHSRSTQAANRNGGFAKDTNAFGISFNGKEDGGNAGRSGVGNVSKDDPHNTHPGDGGNGVHAANNDALSSRLDPVTGDAVE